MLTCVKHAGVDHNPSGANGLIHISFLFCQNIELG